MLLSLPRAPAPHARLRRLALGGLAVLAALLGACGDGEPARQRPAHRLLVVGWDGAAWELVDPLLAQGRLPNLARLIERGVSAGLQSTVVPISSAAWIGAVTGRNPAQTGVYGFFEPIEGTYEVSLISSRSNQATPIWRTLGRHGLRSVVVGMPVTYPPEPIAGAMVAGMLAPKDSTYTWPPGLTARLREAGYVPDLGIWRDANAISGPVLERQLRAKRRVVQQLLAEEDWDLGFIVYKELDVLSHFAYDGSPGGIVASLYERLDQELGALLADVGPDTNVLVLSDHGFHAFAASFYPHAWLIEQGYAVRSPEAPTAEDLERMPLAQRRALENSLQMAELDLQRTRAFAGLSEGNFGSVRLNLAGREPRGIVAPADASTLLDEIQAGLAALRTPTGDRPLVVRFWRREELYQGPHEDLIPDLLFETDLDVAVRPISHTESFQRHSPPFPDHRREGILVGAGPSLRSIAERGQASILDVGPTALHLLGRAVYQEMDGRVLAELLAGLPPPSVVLEASETPRPQERRWLEDTSWSDPEMEEIKRRLGQMGYVETR